MCDPNLSDQGNRMFQSEDLSTFMETCREFELGQNAPIRFQYAVNSAQDAAFVMLGGRKGIARLSWYADGFINIEAYTELEEIIFYRQFETKDGWAFLLPSLEELTALLTISVRQ